MIPKQLCFHGSVFHGQQRSRECSDPGRHDAMRGAVIRSERPEISTWPDARLAA